MTDLVTTHRRLALTGLAALALVAACQKPVTIPAGGPDTPSAGGGASSTTNASGSDAGGVVTTPPRSEPTGRTPTTVAPRPAEVGVSPRAGLGGPGSFARTLLAPTPAKRLLLMLLVQSGASPQSTTIEHLKSELSAASGKSVTVSAPVTLPDTGEKVTAEQIAAMADEFGRRSGGDQAVVNMLFLTGAFAGGDGVLGVTVRGDTFAVFQERIRGATTPFVSRTTLEDAVSTHELGHVLGLVDLARDTGRDDAEHPGHSPSRGSVMYWAVESDVVSQVLGGPPSRQFDAADKADLAALRGGA